MASFIEIESKYILKYYYDTYNKILNIKSIKSIIKIYFSIFISYIKHHLVVQTREFPFRQESRNCGQALKTLEVVKRHGLVK